jgi:hypothetical protein
MYGGRENGISLRRHRIHGIFGQLGYHVSYRIQISFLRKAFGRGRGVSGEDPL